MKNIVLALGLLSLVTFVGCGPSSVSSSMDFVDVTGEVVVDGKPLTQGTVHFEPAEAGKGREDMAAVKDGKFTNKMAIGKYKVALNMNTESKAVAKGVPAKFQKYATSGLTAEVTSGSSSLKIEAK